jgi:hypothetical protein
MNLIVRKANHTVSLQLIQPFRALSVIFYLLCMGIAINFDHQFRFGAEKVHDVGSNRVLSAKLHAELIIANVLPQSLFGGCHCTPQFPRAGLHFFLVLSNAAVFPASSLAFSNSRV